MTDPTEDLRRAQLVEINTSPTPEGQTWTTDQMMEDFTVDGFMAPYVVVRRKSDGKLGTLAFKHSPRVYFDFQEDSR